MTTFVQGGVIHYVGVSLECLPLAWLRHGHQAPVADNSQEYIINSRGEQQVAHRYSLAEMANGHFYDNSNLSQMEYQEHNYQEHNFGHCNQQSYSRSLGQRQCSGDLHATGSNWQVTDMSRSSDTSMEGMSGVDSNDIEGFYSTPPPLYSELMQRPRAGQVYHHSGWIQPHPVQESSYAYCQDDDQPLIAGLEVADHATMGYSSHAQQVWA